MLPKVSATLAQWIQPLQTRTATASSDQPRDDDPRHSAKQERPPPPEPARQEALGDLFEAPAPEAPRPGLTTAAKSWFELLAQPGQGLRRLFGLRAYQSEVSAGGEQKKLRKGILFTRDVR